MWSVPRLSTIHSAKGLDAACVLLFAAREVEAREDEEARIARAT